MKHKLCVVGFGGIEGKIEPAAHIEDVAQFGGKFRIIGDAGKEKRRVKGGIAPDLDHSFSTGKSGKHDQDGDESGENSRQHKNPFLAAKMITNLS